MTLSIREKPPLRLTYEAQTPGGRVYRWASDASDPRDKPSGATFSSTMPGGHAEFSVTLPRKAGDADADLERLTTIQAKGVGGAIASEARLERAPRVTGDQMSVSPSAVGWQAHLGDDKSASIVGVDRDLGRWAGPSRAAQIAEIGAGYSAQSPQVRPNKTSGLPVLTTEQQGAWASTSKLDIEAWYDAGESNRIGRVRASWTRGANVALPDANWDWHAACYAGDDYSGPAGTTSNLRATGPGTIDLTPSAAARFAVFLLSYATGPAGSDNVLYGIDWTNVRVFGDHQITIRGDTAAAEGLYASDIVAYVVRRWAPLLNFSEGVGGTIQPSTFVIPQFTYPDATNAGELVRQATRFGLQDWAVWDNKTLYWHERGTRGRSWRARSGPTKLEETGPQIDRLWESVIVQYRDVDGSTRTVGPPGSGAGTEDASLKDLDPDNPANRLGMVRRDMLQAGTLTASGAVELGRRFLAAQKLLDSSGRATITGHVLDDHGILHPYWRIRAGDTISFTDAADTSPRRIVSANHATDSYSCTVDLDSPPDGMDALLERLGVALVPLGV